MYTYFLLCAVYPAHKLVHTHGILIVYM